ncbi:cytochrome P450 2B11-like isoform X1 [Hyperolius riggenbachi]|uniref:cytochrome P450 2B11-like isoform X1 n=1 Tax=Hyperolius riggenbachi TaxID=752182 RepID=UPI0035A3355D
MFAFDPFTALVSVLVILFLIKVYNNQKQPKNLPPGPRPLPIIGNLHQLDPVQPYKTLTEMSKIYGPVYSVHFWLGKAVVLCGYDTIKDAFLNHAEEFSNRPVIPLMTKITKDHGLTFSNGESWKAMRRFTLSTLRDYGMGKKAIEDKINEEAECLIQAIRSHEGKPFDNLTIINAAVANIIISILLGYRFSYDDPTILYLMNLIHENMKLGASKSAWMYNRFPALMRLLPGPHQTVFANMRHMLDFLTSTFTKQRKDLDVNNQRNLIDAFLVKQHERKSPYSKYFHNDNLAALVGDLFLAGMETTTTTLRWGLLLMMKYPHIQAKVQKEIDNIIGTAPPQPEHRKEMPYTDAVIHEIQRFGSIAPNGVPHATTQDLTFKGYFIPKGMTVLPVLYSALTDEAYFKKPHEFYPEHFLDAEGTFIKNEAFIPFSIGITGRMFAFDPFTALVSVLVILFLAKVYNNQKQPKNLPPGPRPLPIVGNLLLLDPVQPYKTLTELSKKYGPVYTVHFGLGKAVVLCGYDTIKDAFLNHAEEFSNRPVMPLVAKITKDHGLIFSNGESWKAMRRFTLSTLRDYGMGKKAISDKINEEAECLMQAIRSHEGKPFDNLTIINAAVSNIIISILLGYRFSYDDPTILYLMNLINENMKLVATNSARMYNRFPTIMGLLPGPHHKVFANIRQMLDFITKTFTKQKKDLDVNNLRNLIDAFLVKQQETKSPSSKYFHNDNLAALVGDLFLAGMETTTTTLRWGLLLMMKYPHIQEKVQKEIDNIIGTASPQPEHRKEMPYTDAVIHEIQRFGSIAPNGVPHATTQDLTFKGYFIPKGMTIFPVLYSVLIDEAYFEKPHEFYPEHFLDAEGKFKKNEAFIPFSIGKRSCAGETLAKMELFLFFTSLLQNFTFQAPPGAELDLNPARKGTRSPQTHMVCAIPRN